MTAQTGVASGRSDWRDKAATGFAAGDAFVRRLGLSAALVILFVFGAALVFLVQGSRPALEAFGLRFFTTEAWSPVAQRFGAAASIYGTATTAAIAILIVAPVGIGIAIFLAEICPRNLRRPTGVVVELAAAVPSVIYGAWGLFVLAPFMERHVEPLLIALFDPVPILRELFAGPPHGVSLLTAALILAIMALPFVASTLRDVLTLVPPTLRESAYAVGCTHREVVGRFVIPYARSAVMGALALGLGRALGETIAVAFVVGKRTRRRLRSFSRERRFRLRSSTSSRKPRANCGRHR